MKRRERSTWLGLLLVLFLIVASTSCTGPREEGEKVGVLFIVHGGMETVKPQYMWDSAVQWFSYDHNHPVYKFVIWNAGAWPMVMDPGTTVWAKEFLLKYGFSYPRIGGVDPHHRISEKQVAAMKAELDKNPYGITFEVDWAGLLVADPIDHYPYPRFIYSPPSGKGDKCTYCGEKEKDGPWPDCNPERYNVDGPAERLLNKGVSKIIAVDLTTTGVRFSKTFDVIQMTKKALSKWNAEHGTSVPLIWVNDYSSSMERSYPVEPEGWTRALGLPTKDRHVLLNGSPNPVAEDPDLAQLYVKGIEAALSSDVADTLTGVVLMNHNVHNHNEVFDPKINDTLVLNRNIKSQLIGRHPEMDPDNIVGAWGGLEKLNPENGLVEHSREMRGERLGYAYLYESNKQLPSGEWGYRYWDALKYLKNRGVKHMVIAFPQIPSDSVLNLIEVYNQFGKEIGTKTWAKWGTWDYETYPGVGHPFGDYYGNWVNTDCGGVPCCFEMGGCADGRPYPPPRQAPIDKKMGSFDPSLAYDLSDYGHLGYDPAKGPPDPNKPVQDQYTGTWDVWTAPNEDPGVGKFLAKHALNAAVNPLVYITNGELESLEAGESITFEAHVVTGTPEYAYEWSIKKNGVADWSPVGKNSSTWTWMPKTDDGGTHNIRCKVTDKKGGAGEVVWKEFEVTT